MKILIITLNAWNDSNSTGNTISNLFSGINNKEVANIYCREDLINNSICQRYFKITENQIIKNIFTKKNCGLSINNYTYFTKSTNTSYNPLANNNIGNWLRKYRPTILLFLRELIWSTSIWKNDKLNQFLNDFQPDIIYMHGHSNIYMHKVLDYCREKTHAKTVLFFGDDMYNHKSKMPLSYIYEIYLRKRLKKSITNASVLFGGSFKLCIEYTEIFNKKFNPLFKQCDLSNLKIKNKINNPIKIVYAGNLLFGREEILLQLASSIRLINQSKREIKILLVTYSNTKPSKQTIYKLNDGSNTFFMGCKDYSDICIALNDADLCLFAESFNKYSIKQTRLSFSTKIIDCLQSSSALLAIGPSNIASMEYIINSNLGFTITNLDNIFPILYKICENPESIIEYADRKTGFAKKHHSNTSSSFINQISIL